MSEENKLNSQLSEVESILRRVEIPAAEIDRDELMYQSGWAAALASQNSPVTLAESDSPLLKTENRNSHRQPPSGLPWRLMTAVASFLAVVLGMMWGSQLQSNRELVANAASKLADVQNDLVVDQAQDEKRNADGSVIGNSSVENLAAIRPEAPDLLNLIMELADDSELVSGAAIRPGLLSSRIRKDGRATPKTRMNFDEESSVKTRQEMLDELLPSRS